MFRLAVGPHNLLSEHTRYSVARSKVAEAQMFHAVFRVNKERRYISTHMFHDTGLKCGNIFTSPGEGRTL
jgi:hypothetical protein